VAVLARWGHQRGDALDELQGREDQLRTPIRTRLWQVIDQAVGIELLVKLGDSIYADFPSPDLDKAQAESLDDFRRKHNEVYSTRLGLNAFADPH
jgi:hypothetical protein